jgi:hypothetical protein
METLLEPSPPDLRIVTDAVCCQDVNLRLDLTRTEKSWVPNFSYLFCDPTGCNECVCQFLWSPFFYHWLLPSLRFIEVYDCSCRLW